MSIRSRPSPLWLALVGVVAFIATSCRGDHAEPPNWPVRIEPKRVFAHYMVCCPEGGANAGVADFEREILAAQSRGIDGFALNCGGWSREPHYRSRMLDLYRAARKLDSGFLLFPSADFCCGLTNDDVVEMMREFYDHPNQLRHDGRPVLSSFTGGENFREVLERLRDDRKPIALVPYVLPKPVAEHPRGGQIDEVFERLAWADGFFFFAGPGTGAQHAKSNELLARKWLGAGKIFMAGITPYYRGHGGNYRLYETRGFEGMAEQWENIIRLDIPWVEIVTWNDWGEASYVAPHGPPDDLELWNGHWGPVPSHTAYLDASRYYIEWFKSGRRPEIARDRVFYFYRPHPKNLEGIVKPGEAKRGKPAGSGSLYDSIFATAFLTARAELTIACGGAEKTFSLPAGVHHVELPFAPGRPRFTLARGGEVLVEKNGEHEISARDAWANFNYFGGAAEAPEKK